MRCSELCELLEALGFDVRAGKKSGHKIVTHRALDDFYSFSFDCGHGRNPEVKPVYVRSALKLLRHYERPLKQHMAEDGR